MKRLVRSLTWIALLVMSTSSLGAASAQESGTITFSATRSCDDAITWIVTSPVTAQMYIGFSNTSDNWSEGPSPFSTNSEYNQQTYGRQFFKVAFFNPGAEGFILLATLDVGACGVTASTTLAVGDIDSLDTDGDRINDDADECPEVAGPADNGGCPVVEVPGFWSVESASLVCTATGVVVTYTITGSENVAAEGDVADIQVRPGEGGIPVVSEFGNVTQGNPGPYTVSIESEDLTSGVFQAWVFKVGSNDHVYSQAINCDEAPVTPSQPGDGETPGEGETPDEGETPPVVPDTSIDGDTGSESNDDASASAGNTSDTSAVTVTSLPSTGSGTTPQSMPILMLIGLSALAILGGAWKLRRVE